MGIPILGANTSDPAYEIANSLRFDGSTSRLTREFDQDPTGNRKTFTISCWVKRSKITANQTVVSASTTNNFNDKIIGFRSTYDQIEVNNVASGSDAVQIITNRAFRDVSAWYHIVVAIDTTQSSLADGVKFYVNGVRDTNFDGTPVYNQNATFEIGRNGSTTAIGRLQVNDSQYLGGYVSEFYFVDGQQLDPTYFGEFDSNGTWVPVEPGKGAGGSITYGNNGFLLEFKQTGTSQNSSGIGADTSGNDQHFAVSGLHAQDVCVDTPTNNFMTMNPLTSNSRGTFAEGNLMVTTNVQGSVPYGQVEFGNFAVNQGKWYFEAKINSEGSGGSLGVGVNERWEAGGYTNGHNNGGSSGNIRWNSSNGNIVNGSQGSTSGSSYTTNDIIGFAMDLDNNKIYVHKNGTYQNSGDPAAASNGITMSSAYNDYWTPWISKDDTTHNATVEFNFGNPTFTISSTQADDNGYGSFEYDVPAGYYSLCTKNLAEFG